MSPVSQPQPTPNALLTRSSRRAVAAIVAVAVTAGLTVATASQQASAATSDSQQHSELVTVARFKAGTKAFHYRGKTWHADAALRPGGHLVKHGNARSESSGSLYETSRVSTDRYQIPLAKAGDYFISLRFVRCSDGTCSVHHTQHEVRIASASRVSVPLSRSERRYGVAAIVVRERVRSGSAGSAKKPVAPVSSTSEPTTSASSPTTSTPPTSTPPTSTQSGTSSAGAGSGSSPTQPASLLQPENVLGSNSVWSQDIGSAPLDSNSPAMVNNLVSQVQAYYGGTAAFNAYQYNVNWYNVGADQATTTVAFSNCQHKTYTPAGLFGTGGQFVDVPIPSDAVPAVGTDATMTIYRPSTDQLWELWRANLTSSGWSACWGGRIDNVSSNPGYFSKGFGASATGLLGAAGDISISDVESGVINHAVYLSIPAPATWKNYSWPAQRSDGSSTDPNAIPEGTRLRLDPTLDVDALHLNPLATMIAKAAQKYGFIVTNKAGCVAVTTESGVPTKTATGVNPWNQILGNTPPYKVMKNFPWQSMQVLPKNY